MLVYLIVGIVGMLIGVVVVYFCVPTAGVLQIDSHNDGKDVYRLEVTCQMEKLPTYKWIKFSVDPNADFSQIKH